jgi:hypothetical protein
MYGIPGNSLALAEAGGIMKYDRYDLHMMLIDQV